MNWDAEITTLFISYSSNKLQKMHEAIVLCLSKLSEDQIWYRASDNENAIGNLILHLCGNMQQWIGSGVGGEQDSREREAEFAARGTWSKESLLQLLEERFAYNLAILAAVTPARMVERITPQGYDVAVLEAIYQVVGHFQQHTGQIIFATKLLTSEDLKIYVPHPSQK